MALGRPSIYSQELATEICRRLAEGESLRAITNTEGMPSKSTVLEWVLDGKHKEFADQYERARQMQAEVLTDELMEIADDGKNDWMERHYGDATVWVENGEAIGRSRLRLDARKWIASKILPKKYGEKQQIEHSGNVQAVLSIGGLTNANS